MLSLLRLPGVTANLWNQEIYTKRSVLVLQEALELGNLFSKHVWSVANASNDTQTAGICDGGSKLGSCGHVHTCEHDRVVDFEEVGDRGAELF